MEEEKVLETAKPEENTVIDDMHDDDVVSLFGDDSVEQVAPEKPEDIANPNIYRSKYLDEDILYRGPLSFRTMRTLAFLCLFIMNFTIIIPFVNKLQPLPEWTDKFNDVCELFGALSVPLMLLSTFCRALSGQKSPVRVLRFYTLNAILIIGITTFVFEHYLVGLVQTAQGVTDKAVARAYVSSVLANASKDIPQFNVFMDMMLVTSFYYFLIYTPKEWIKKKQIKQKATEMLENDNVVLNNYSLIDLLKFKIEFIKKATEIVFSENITGINVKHLRLKKQIKLKAKEMMIADNVNRFNLRQRKAYRLKAEPIVVFENKSKVDLKRSVLFKYKKQIYQKIEEMMHAENVSIFKIKKYKQIKKEATEAVIFENVNLTDTKCFRLHSIKRKIHRKAQEMMLSENITWKSINVKREYIKKAKKSIKRENISGTKLKLFRTCALLPVMYAIGSFIIYALIREGKLTVPFFVFSLLTCKSPIVYCIFFSLILILKRRERSYIRKGGTLEGYNAFVKTNANSLHFSLILSLLIFVFCIIDLILYFVILFVAPQLDGYGFGDMFSMLLAIPAVLLLSYTRTYKDTYYDLMLPFIFVIASAILYLEVGYQILNGGIAMLMAAAASAGA